MFLIAQRCEAVACDTERVVEYLQVRWGEKNRAAGRIFLEHALLVTDVMIAIELACRTSGIRSLTEEELANERSHKKFRWRVSLAN